GSRPFPSVPRAYLIRQSRTDRPFRHVVEDLVQDSADEKGTRIRFRAASGPPIEEGSVIQIAGTRAVAALHVVSIDLQSRLRVDLRAFGQQEGSAELVAVGLLCFPADHDLALEDTTGLVVQDAVIDLPRACIGSGMIDHTGMIE